MKYNVFCVTVQACMGHSGGKNQNLSQRKLQRGRVIGAGSARWLHSWQKAFPVVGTACAEAWRGETARVSRVLSASPCTSFHSTSTFLSHLMIVVPSKSLFALLFSNPQPPTFSKNIVELNATQLPHRGSDLSLILWLYLKGTLLVFYFIIKVYVYIAKKFRKYRKNIKMKIKVVYKHIPRNNDC